MSYIDAEKLRAAAALVADGNIASDVPTWIRASISTTLSNLASQQPSAKDLAEQIMAIWKMIYDSSYPSDDDPVILAVAQFEDE